LRTTSWKLEKKEQWEERVLKDGKGRKALRVEEVDELEGDGNLEIDNQSLR